MSGGGSALYRGHVAHRRLRPRAHRLRYRIFSLLIDLDELPGLARRLRLFAHNRFGLFAIHDADHLGGTATPLRDQVERHLAAAGIGAGGAIRLLTMPRILGFAFNPLSLYFCHAPDGALAAILYEVNNTFGQRHIYLIAVDPGAAGPIRQSCAKAFHVSPFLGLDMRYDFVVLPPGGDYALTITGSSADGVPLIVARHRAVRRALSDAALAHAFVAYPLLTLKVVGGILFEAARLWAKGVPVHACPPPPAHPVSHIVPKPAREKEAACI